MTVRPHAEELPGELRRWAVNRERCHLDPSLLREAADALDALAARVAEMQEALLAYETAVQSALRRAPNHWQVYRDPLELGPEIRGARQLARSLASAVVGEPEDNDE